MDRQIVYSGQIPLETDLLLTNKNTMLALGSLMQAVLGSSVCLDGLACTPNTPAALNVLVGPGSIYSLQNVDGTAYGTVAADTTNQTVKQGLAVGTTTLSCPAPVTTGQSVVYLVQAAYQDTDAGGAVLPYYNAASPNVPWSGPNNTGVSQNTVRKGVCLVGVKTGTPATTGTQTTPAPDAGYTGLYAVTVANGQTTITSGNIQQLAAAPFIATKLPAMLTAIQQDTPNYAQDTSGAANTITVALSPSPAALTNGMEIRTKIANSSTGATVMNVNGLGNVACKTTSGADFGVNTVVANGIYTFVYDANGTRFQLQGFTAATATGLVPANNLSDVTNPATALANIGGTIPTGVVWDFEGAAASVPNGWLLCSGKTIGSASSNGTARANADTQALFNLLWADHTNTTRPIFTSAGAASTRGANAAADWAANKAISLPDDRGLVSVGKDDMGGTAANRITSGVCGLDGTVLGASGGDQRLHQHTHTATVTDPGHTHVAAAFKQFPGASGSMTDKFLSDGNTTNGSGVANPTTNSATTGITVSNANAGAGSSQNVQPSMVRNRIIKL